MSTHFCGWPNCRERVPGKLLMCRAHWYSLPSLLRHRILSTYVPGQSVADWSEDYKRAYDAVQAWIAQHGRGAAPSR